MFKLVTICLLWIGLCEAALSTVQLVVPDDTYSVLTVGKSSTNTLDNSIPSLSNAISEENQLSNALSEESNEPAASNTTSQSPASDTADVSSTAIPQTGSSPAAITRVKPLRAFSAISPASAATKETLIISPSALASAAENSLSNPLNITSPISLVHPTSAVQHRILPAETIPLPITISTRPGLRTVIAPETITIQQPGIAKIGEIVQQIPTAVSHQQQTVVHNHARIVTPIVAPAVRTVTSQIVRAYHTPLVYAPHVVEN